MHYFLNPKSCLVRSTVGEPEQFTHPQNPKSKIPPLTPFRSRLAQLRVRGTILGILNKADIQQDEIG
jgi:hypothetical protein